MGFVRADAWKIDPRRREWGARTDTEPIVQDRGGASVGAWNAMTPAQRSAQMQSATAAASGGAAPMTRSDQPSLSSRGGLVGPGAFDRQQEMQFESDLRMKEQERQQAFLREQASGRRSSMDALIGRFDKETNPAQVEYQGPIQGQEDAARGAAFARAKEMAAMNARASMTALEDLGAEQGFTGSTMQAGEAGRVIGGARADIHDFIREQQISDTDRAREVANMRYQGGITQRGQDLGRQQQRQQAILSLLGSLY